MLDKAEDEGDQAEVVLDEAEVDKGDPKPHIEVCSSRRLQSLAIV